MKRKVLACMLALSLIVSMIPVVSFAGIIPVDISDSKLVSVRVDGDNYEYDGTAKTPEVVVKYGITTIFTQKEDGSTELGLGLKDVSKAGSKATYTDNVEAGTAKVKVSLELSGLLNKYSGSAEKEFTINKRPISSTELFKVNCADRSKTIEQILKDSSYKNIYSQASDELAGLIEDMSKEYDGSAASNLTKAYAAFITSPYSYDLVAVEGTAVYKSTGVSDKAQLSFTPSSVWGSQADNYYLVSSAPVVVDAKITKKTLTVAPNDVRVAVNETPDFTFSAGGVTADKEVTQYLESLGADDIIITDENGKQTDLGAVVSAPGKYTIALKEEAVSDLDNYIIKVGKATLTVRGESTVVTYDRYKMGYEAHVGNDGVATVSGLSTDRLKEVGSDGDIGYAELDLTETGKAVTGASIPYNELQKVITELEKNPFILGFYLSTSQGSIKLDTKAISVMAAEAQLADRANLEIGFETLGKAELTPAQSTELAAYNLIKLFRVYAKCGSTELKSVVGSAEIIFPYKVPSGLYWYKYKLKEFGGDGSITDKIAIQNDTDGTVSVSINKLSAFAFAYEKCDGGFTCPSYWFDDVNVGDWYHDSVDFAAAAGIMNGIDMYSFAPDRSLTRGMIVTMLWRMQDKPAGKTGVFSDVKAGAYYEEAIGWAESVGIVNGYSQVAFGPDDAVTREQLSAILYRYAKYTGKSVDNTGSLDIYTDRGEVSDYALEEMKWAVGAGLINGTQGNRLEPKGNATRAQVAQILYRYETN